MNSNDSLCQVWMCKRRRLLKIVYISTYFGFKHPWKKVCLFIWTLLNSHQVRMFFAKCGWNWAGLSRDEDFRCHQLISLGLSHYIPLGKGLGSTFKQTWYSSSRMFYPKFEVIGSVVLELMMKMWSFYRQTDRQDGRKTDKQVFSSGELKGLYMYT